MRVVDICSREVDSSCRQFPECVQQCLEVLHGFIEIRKVENGEVWCSSMVSGYVGQCSSVPGEVQASSDLCLEYPESVWSVWKSSGGVTECLRMFQEAHGNVWRILESCGSVV